MSEKPALDLSGVIVCYAKCDSCTYGFGEACYDPPQWHTWAGPEDIDHARATGQPDPTTGRCGCPCAVEPATILCSCGKPFPEDGGAEGVCECCSGCAGTRPEKTQ